jgi:hypothetical protein
MTNYYEHEIVRDVIARIFCLPIRGSGHKCGSLWTESLDRFSPLMPLPVIALAATVVEHVVIRPVLHKC